MKQDRKLTPAIAVGALGMSSFMITLDATALHVALPTIAADLGGSLAELQWVINAYTLVFAGLLLSSGTLSDRLGARRVFLWALMFFVSASAVCGFASTIEILIAARAVQGIGAAAILPSSMALLLDAFPDPKLRARALGAWSAISAIALVAGPLLGGFLAGTLGWRAIFLLNLPVGLLAFAGALLAVGHPKRHKRALDAVGQTLGFIALVMLVFAATEGRAYGWTSSIIIGAIGIGTLSGLGFILVERRHIDPMLPPTLFRSPAFTGAIAGAFLYNFAYYGALFALSIILQADGSAPVEVGLKFAPMTATTSLFAFALGHIVARFGAYLPGVLTLAIGAAGTAVLILGGLTSWPFFIGSLLIGIGGSTLPALVSATLENVPSERAGVGSAVLNSSRQAGGAFGVAILGTLIASDAASLALALIVAGFLLGALALFMGQNR